MNWQQVCEDPSLQDLPFKIETNEYVQIVMSPASNQHGLYQMRIGALMTQSSANGEVIAECYIETPKGVKVPDIAWLSNSFLKRHVYTTPYPQPPEICVEITSPSNSSKELARKRRLYFSQGAKEVWICDLFGNVGFHTPAGESTTSALFPEFPANI